MSLEIKDHKNSQRVKIITLKESELDRLIFPFKKHTITSLEYKPFSRFTLAKSVNEVFEGKLSESLVKILNDRKLADAYKSLETIHDTYGRVIGNDAIQLRQRLEQMLKQDVKRKVLNWDEVWSTL